MTISYLLVSPWHQTCQFVIGLQEGTCDNHRSLLNPFHHVLILTKNHVLHRGTTDKGFYFDVTLKPVLTKWEALLTVYFQTAQCMICHH